MSARFPGPGIFVSHTSTTEWEPDPDPGGLMHMLCDQDGVEAGLSRFDEVDGPIVWTLPAREVILILEGAARIEIEGAETLDLVQGSIASMPKGAVTTWHITTPFRELWVLSGE